MVCIVTEWHSSQVLMGMEEETASYVIVVILTDVGG